jgi:redox-regulated HSP33 family molecular chaperone
MISDDRTIKLLSDAESLMPENINKETKFVNLLIGVNKENIEHTHTHELSAGCACSKLRINEALMMKNDVKLMVANEN